MKVFKLILAFIVGIMRTVVFPSSVTAYADVNTVVNNGAGFNRLDDATRVVYSKEIMFKAMPNMRFYQFASVKTELGVEPGLTISMMTYDNLAMGGTLTEGVPIVAKNLSTSMKSITVAEKGNAVQVTELTLRSSFDDIMSSVSTLLARDYATVLDCELRDTALRGTNVIYGRKDGAAKINARSSITDANPLSVAAIKDAVEILATNNAPKFAGNYYVCFVHPHQSRVLRDDPAWIEASKYGAPDQLFTGEIGRIEDVRFIETTLMCNGAAGTDDPAYVAELASDATVPVYQAVLFGENYYGVAHALPVELRDDPPKDFGREHGMAWYAIWGADLLQEDNGVVIETC